MHARQDLGAVMAYHPDTEGHRIEMRAFKRDDKWEIVIYGVTSSFEVRTFKDDVSIRFYLDAERFHPELDVIP
jgi:hypothetical protein